MSAPVIPPPNVKATPSSFYWAMRILPEAQRNAMFQIYDFCRQVDDIADGDLPQAEKSQALHVWRDQVKALEAHQGPDMLQRVYDLYGLDVKDFLAVLDGMETDVPGHVRMADRAALDTYIDRVASAVGRLSNPIFGLSGEPADRLAYHLGRALQLTNILRDVAEDAAIDRVYLPKDLLAQHGIVADDVNDILAHPHLPAVLAELASEARGHYEAARTAIAALPSSKTRAPRIMLVVYCRLLRVMESRGWGAFQTPVKVSMLMKLWLVFTQMVL